MKNKSLLIFFCILSLVIGAVGGGFAVTYITMPETEELIIGEEVFYSYKDQEELSNVALTGEAGELSVHFLELGNKYTGDCTYIRYGDVDILIDCGSKSTSIPYVEQYLKNYMTDNTIEYCIVTHAHADHYAGFATSGKVTSLFEIFDFGTIIDFGSATNKNIGSSATGMMKNYQTKRQIAINNGAEYFDASTGVSKNNNKVFEIGDNGEVTLEILYNYYYDNHTSSSENNYSVCAMLEYQNKQFLFTGDLEEHNSNGETKLIENNQSLLDIKNNPNERVEVYKAGHHGSKTSSSEAFIDAIRPEIVCVCCCAGSPEYTNNIDNQFPTQQFINIIAKHTDKIYVTTLCVDWETDQYTSMNGNIVAILKPGESIGINCSNNTIKLKDTEWFNRQITYNGTTRPMRVWPSL